MDDVEKRDRPPFLSFSRPETRKALDSAEPSEEIEPDIKSKPSVPSGIGIAPGTQVELHEEHPAGQVFQRNQEVSNMSTSHRPNHEISKDKNFESVLEADTCRICSSPAEPGQPLYHPCRCTGSIRYVHQDCLRSWLKASSRTRCDLCNYPYKYKKIYSQDMPQELAIKVVLWPLLGQIIHWMTILVRLALVTTLWLAIIPALVYWCWQVGFLMGDYVSLRISGNLQYLELYSIQLHNLTENAPISPMPSTRFSSTLSPVDLTPTLISLLPSNTPSSQLYQTTPVSYTSFSKDTSLSTTTQTTPHPSSSIIASAFSHIASVMQSHNFKHKRRSRFRPLTSFNSSSLPTNVTIPQHLSIFLTGKPLFTHQSSVWLDCIRLLYMVLARAGSWMSSAVLAILVIPYDIYAHSFKNASTASNWKIFTRLSEKLADPIMTGQLIAVSLVICYVGIWFVREWVLANAEDGAFAQGRRGRANAEVAPVVQNNAGGGARIPGAFPEQPLDVPVDDFLEEDLDFAFEEPTTPPLNVISLEEQEELMQEVQKKRAESAEVGRKRHAQIEEWQVEKTTQIVEEWKDQKLKEILSRLGDGVTPNSVRLEGVSAPSTEREEHTKYLQALDVSVVESIHPPSLETVEHIEHTDQIRQEEPPAHSHPVVGLVDASTTSDSPVSPAPTVPSSSFGPFTADASPSRDPERWSSRFFPRTIANEGSSSSSPGPSASSKPTESSFWTDLRSNSSSKNASESDLGSFVRATLPPPGPSSVFATLVPPAQPSSGQQLPFSIRDFRVAPLDPETPPTGRSAQAVSRRSGLVLRSSSTGVLGQDSVSRGHALHQGLDGGDLGSSLTARSASSSNGGLHTDDLLHDQRNFTRLPNKENQALQKMQSEDLSDNSMGGQPLNWSGQPMQPHTPFVTISPVASVGTNHPVTPSHKLAISVQSQTAEVRTVSGLNINAPVFQPRYTKLPPVLVPNLHTHMEPARPSPSSSSTGVVHGHSTQTMLLNEPIEGPPVIGYSTSHPSATEWQRAMFGQPSPPVAAFNPTFPYPLAQRSEHITGPFTQTINPLNPNGRPKHGHSMSMGMGFKSTPSFASLEDNPRQRGRSLTTGTSNRSADGQNREYSPLTSLSSHQRSNSLSNPMQPTTTSVTRSEVNHLLKPTEDSGSSSPDDIKSKLKVKGALWYGLPDSQRGFEPKHLLLEDEKDKQAQPNTLKGKGKKRRGNKRTSEASTTEKQDLDMLSSSRNTLLGAQSVPDTVSTGVQPSELKPEVIIVRQPTPKQDHSIPLVNLDRAKPPGPISLPSPRLQAEDVGPFPKRPSLASAASPALLESPSKVALYQAPEEVQTRANPLESKAYFEQTSSSINEIIHIKEIDSRVAMDGKQLAPHTPVDPLFVDEVFDGAANEPLDDVDPLDGVDVAPLLPAEDDRPGADPVVLDEFGQVLEMVGMRGAWQGVVQNATLVVVIFALTLGSGVFTPYMVGKTTSLLFVDSSDMVRQLFLDTTGPDTPNPDGMSQRSLKQFSVIGGDLALLVGDILCFSVDAGRFLGRSFKVAFRHLVGQADVASASTSQATSPNWLLRIWALIRPTSIISWGTKRGVQLLFWWRDHTCDMKDPSGSSATAVMFGLNRITCALPLERFRDAAKDNHPISHLLFSAAEIVATDRVAAIVTGYLLIFVIYALRAKLHPGSHSSLPLALIKVSILVSFYAFVRPFMIGAVVNMFLHTLLHPDSALDRYNIQPTARFTNGIRHWILGNGTLTFVFEIFRALQRLFRPGALHRMEPFINPRTPSIRSMVHKSMNWHITHALFSLFSTIMLLWIVLGLPIDLNKILTPALLPMQLDIRNSSFEIPVDLVTLHLCIPAMLRFLKVKKLVKKTAKAFLLQSSRLLRLEYVFFDHSVPSSGIFEGTFWRVPVAEGAVVLAGQPRAIRTDGAGNGITQEDRDRIDMQLVASERVRRNPAQDYHVVFYPDHLEIRMAAFAVACWFGLFAAYWISITLPVLSGRLIFKSFGIVGIFDGYAWMLSFCILWVGAFGKYLIDREQRKWNKYFENTEDAPFPFDRFIARIFVVINRLILSVVLLAGLAPLSIGLLFEVYVVLPLSYHLYPGSTPTIRIADVWMTGSIILAIGIQGLQFGEAGRLPQFLDVINRDGWVRLKTRTLIKEALLPCIAIMVMVVIPFAIQLMLPTIPDASGQFILKYFFPSLCALFASASILAFLQTTWDYWIETVRDRNYLEYEMIENLEGSGLHDPPSQESMVTE
ncbi:hypothetical protein FRC16_010890 [Serendipita sp. 398]|nr:hypothetical protein FRC16_010890 [Serendipita sp. 398]